MFIINAKILRNNNNYYFVDRTLHILRSFTRYDFPLHCGGIVSICAPISWFHAPTQIRSCLVRWCKLFSMLTYVLSISHTYKPYIVKHLIRTIAFAIIVCVRCAAYRRTASSIVRCDSIVRLLAKYVRADHELGRYRKARRTERCEFNKRQ